MSDVLINPTTSPLPPVIARNGGSDFVVVWTDVGDADIRGRVLLATGATSGDEFAVNTTTEGRHSLPAAAAGVVDFGPGFVVVWIAETPHNVLLQRFAANGTKVGGEVRVSTTDVNRDQRPAVARLVDSNVVVSWVSAHVDEGIHARIFRPDGTALGPEFRVNTSDGVHLGPLSIAPLQNNSFVIAWRGGRSFASTRAHLQIFDPTGAKVGPEKEPNFVGFTGDMALTFVDTQQLSAEPGHFLMARTSSTGGDEERLVIASAFGPDGDLQGEFNVTHLSEQSIASDVAIAALPGQRFAVAWTDRKVPHVGDTSGNNIKAMLCSEQSSILPSPIQVSTTTDGDQTSPSVTASVGELGERIAFAWVDDSVSGSGSSSRAVKARVLSSELRPV
jgi:hypothetical protein